MCLVAYCAWMWLQTQWALDVDEHIHGSSLFLKSVIASWFVYRVADTRERVRDLLLANVIGCGGLGILAYLTGREGDRLDGVGGPGMDDANTLGMYFATAAVLAAGLVLTQKGWRRWLSLGCGLAVMQGLVLTNTRGAFLGLVAGAFVLFLTRVRQNKRVFALMALVGIVGTLSIADTKFIDRMTTMKTAAEAESDEDIDGSALSRIVIVQAQLQMFGNYPLGTGHRGTAVLSPQYLDLQWLSLDRNGDRARSSHNTFMTALVEQGIPGAAIFIILGVWMLRMLWRLRMARDDPADPELRTLTGAICAGIAVVFVAGNTADFLLAEIQFWLLGLFVAALHMLRLPEKSTVVVPDEAPTQIQQSSV
jgi:O-antigen ligase